MIPAPSIASLLDGLPGEELAREGLADLAAGRTSAAALLLEIGASRLRLAGLPIPEIPRHELDAEIRLYRILGSEFGGEAHSQYNALIRRLTSFARALERRSQSPTTSTTTSP